MLALIAVGGAQSATAINTDLVQFRRINEQQYRQSIADIFGADVKVIGRFEPDLRTDGMLAVGASQATVTAAGLEQFTAMGRSIAAQVLSGEKRDANVPCKPKDAAKPDLACAGKYLDSVGRRLYRRPLTQSELKRWTQVAAATGQTSKDFYAGLQFTLAGMLVAPEFLFRMDLSEADPDHAGQRRLTAYSKASRLSFLIWNTTPDEQLLAAAESGDIHDHEKLLQQVDRLLADKARFDHGVRAFFSDFLQLDAFEALEKDKLIYPAFDKEAAADAREQLLRFITDHLVVREEDYRDLLTTRRTFMTRSLGLLYAVPVSTRTSWEPYEFAENDPRAGLLSQVGFTAAHSHPGRSSPTLRGVAIRQLLMCQRVPPAPAAVNFTVVQDTDNPQFKTARDRLTAHRTDAACAGCHKVFDPIGLALENFDGVGQWRTLENGVPIDTSGELDRVPFSSVAELGKALRNHPAIPSCVVSSAYKYAAGRTAKAAEKPWLKQTEGRFADGGFKFPKLLRDIATSDEFFAVPTAVPAQVVAASSTPKDDQ